MNVLKLFEDSNTICVVCNQRMPKIHFSFESSEIGICKSCMRRLSPIAKGSAFEGTPNVKYMISSYYYKNVLKDLIYRYKFRGETKLGDLFYKMLYEYIKDIDILHDFDFITAVPLSSQRFNNRGYNQSEIIARGISTLINVPYVDCIYRSEDTSAQSSLDKRGRVHNISDVFIADKRKTKDKNIILIDDIITTSATMNSCSGELIDKGAKSVIGISLAKTPLCDL